MSDLPSRGTVSSWLHDPDRVVAPSLVFDVMTARASGKLLTAEEWRATIDYEAFRIAYWDSMVSSDAYNMRLRLAFDAAIGDTEPIEEMDRPRDYDDE